jgi:hypothetical protein
VTVHGWSFANSGAAGTIGFWAPTAPTGGKNPVVPGNGAGNALLFTIDVAAGGAPVVLSEAGIYFKDGVFAIASNASITGVLFIS